MLTSDEGLRHRGPHVAEPTELAVEDAAAFWLEVVAVGRAREEAFEPVKLNYDLLGSSVPHMHFHVVPRYADDPRPGWPFPFPEKDPPHWPEETFRADVERLRSLLI